jgi:hypothetical protein
MAKTALNQLQEQIEVIRQEAYAAGYAAAMRAIREFSAKFPSASTPRRDRAVKPPAPEATKKPTRRNRRSAPSAQSTRPSSRPQRGTNARLISEILRDAGSDFVRPAVIRTELQAQKNTSMAFTSIRHSLGQLEAQGEVERSTDGKSWRYIGSGPT